MTLPRAAALVVAGLIVLGPVGPASADEAPPAQAAAPEAAVRAPVERLYAALLDVMKRAKVLGFEGRYHTLEPVIRSSYDIPFMAQLILGRQWDELQPEQQARWLETFERFTISTYADRFDDWSGERFEIGPADPGAQGTSILHTTLVRTDEEPVKLDYRLRQASDGSWRIIDVYLSGTVSELALRRSEYTGIIKREGFDALVAAVGKKVAAAEAGTAEKAGAP